MVVHAHVCAGSRRRARGEVTVRERCNWMGCLFDFKFQRWVSSSLDGSGYVLGDLEDKYYRQTFLCASIQCVENQGTNSPAHLHPCPTAYLVQQTRIGVFRTTVQHHQCRMRPTNLDHYAQVSQNILKTTQKWQQIAVRPSAHCPT